MYRDAKRIPFGDAMMECHQKALAEDADIRLITHSRVRFAIKNSLLKKKRGVWVQDGCVTSMKQAVRVTDVKALEVFVPKEYEGPEILSMANPPGALSDLLGNILQRMYAHKLNATIVVDKDVRWDVRNEDLHRVSMLPGKLIFVPIDVPDIQGEIAYPLQSVREIAFFGYHEEQILHRVDL
jgi:hypothetical protein